MPAERFVVSLHNSTSVVTLCISLSHIFPCLIPFPWADTSRVPHALLSVVAGLSLPSPADSAVSGEEGKNSRII